MAGRGNFAKPREFPVPKRRKQAETPSLHAVDPEGPVQAHIAFPGCSKRTFAPTYIATTHGNAGRRAADCASGLFSNIPLVIGLYLKL